MLSDKGLPACYEGSQNARHFPDAAQSPHPSIDFASREQSTQISSTIGAEQSEVDGHCFAHVRWTKRNDVDPMPGQCIGPLTHCPAYGGRCFKEGVVFKKTNSQLSRVDRLFGVTMAERGISQLVSVDLQTAEGFRATA